MSLTEEIYQELMDGLEKGLDWQQFLAKYGDSKGPLYNAIGKALQDIKTQATDLSNRRDKLKDEVDRAGLDLDQLNQKIGGADKTLKSRNQEIIKLEEEKDTLEKRLELLEKGLGQKSQLLERFQELEKQGLSEERLNILRSTLVHMGTKRGLKPDEVVNRFFAELNDYDAVQGFGQELQRLESVIRTKTLEAERWQAEADSSSRRHKDLSQAIAAVQNLAKHGVTAEQVVSWNGILSKLGGPEKLQDGLGQYKSVSEFLDARKAEPEDRDKRVAELRAQTKALQKQKGEIEDAIASLSSSGASEIAKVGDKAVATLKSLSNGQVQEINRVTDKAVAGVKSLLEEMRAETKRLVELKAEAGKLEKELMYARYLTTGDQATLKLFPKEVVIAFLNRASTYCKLNQLNPMVRVPEGYKNKYSSLYYSSTEVSLLDLIAWAEVGLVGALQ